jgi:2-phosphosulfolactate phosphatase
MSSHSLEVCFSPLSWPLFEKEHAVVIVTDIFRATTSMVAAFENRVKSIIPVAEISESIAYKEKGFIVSGEREGKTLECAAFGNSPFNFMAPELTGQTVVMNTTNGTQALKMVSGKDNLVGIGAFTNRDAICDWAIQQKRDIIIFCAGWKNKFSLEDTLFAGAAAEYILHKGSSDYFTHCDSIMASIDLWLAAKDNPLDYIQKASHRHRLRKMGLDDIIEYSMQLNISRSIPVLSGNKIEDLRLKIED